MPAGIDVCICTYRRPSIADTLRSVAGQVGVTASIRVIVADNDETDVARAFIEATGQDLRLDLHYVHAPARNISVARNACLEKADAPWVAFVDDDLVASPNWLSALLATAGREQADIVFGPVCAHYPEGSPGWASAADMHSTLPTILADRSIVTGYTCNVLMRREAIGDVRFDPELGRSGGEDTIFFYHLWRRGMRIAYASDAIIDEQVDPARLRLGWLVKRSFRSGQTHARILRMKGEKPLRVIPSLVLKIGYCAGAAALGCLSPTSWRKAVVRGALHTGALFAIAGLRDVEIY